jgi:ribosome-associated translation inhibitor RaiA
LKIQLNTDNHVEGHEALEARVNAMLEQHLGRFFTRLTRIEVFLSDSNADKGGGNDKRCALEARRENDRPIGVSHDDEDMEKAIRGACDKLKVRLDEWIQRSRGH